MRLITQNIISLWLSWYLYEIPREILNGWRNFLLFGLNFFSIPLLLKTLFSPWRKYYWVRQRGFDIGEYFSVLFSNLMSRFIGAIVRIIFILFGLIFEVIIILSGFIIFISWFILPIFSILGVLVGFSMIFL